jgi:hypothetical protein
MMKDSDGNWMKHPDGSWDREQLAATNQMHYHVWTQHEMADILSRVGFTLRVIVEQMPDRYDSFLIVATRR